MPKGSALRAVLGLSACLAALGLAATAGAQPAHRALPALAPAPEDALSEALGTGRLTEAEYALERARSLFQIGRVRREFGDVERPGRRDATLVLRDLAARKADLTGADRAVAEAILARPDDGDVPPSTGTGWDPLPASTAEICSAVIGVSVCVHWVSQVGHPDAPNLTDDGPGMPNGVPDYVDLVLATLEETWLEQVGAIDYRPPQDDSDSPNHGPDEQTDIYLDDVGSDLVFGYCTTDDPRALDPDFAVSAYCVLDDDYAPGQYGSSETPEDFLRVTTAHEFFHAVQAAYDFFDDVWLLEGTAANMEETVYAAVDDNVTFLERWSPFTRPGSPLDRAGFGDSEYGSWIFWRYLEEKVAGGDPDIVREIWERADAAPGAPFGDRYSIQAAKNELAQRGHGFSDLFARFATANGLRDYLDGELYPPTRRQRTWRLGPGRRSTGSRSWRINHLASRHFTFAPRGDVPANGRLVVRVVLPKRAARATVVIVNRTGPPTIRHLRANANRVARRVTRFGRNEVKRVLLILTNGSTRMASCFEHGGPPSYSCQGRPRDDRQLFRLRARFVR